MSRDMRGLLKIAREQGYEVRMAGKHRKVYHQGEVVLVMSLTPRARSATQKVEADLRRVGVRFPWRAQRERGDARKEKEQTMVTIETQNGSAHQTEEVRPHRAPLGSRTATVDGIATGPITPDAEVAALLGEGTATEQPRVRTLKVCPRCRREDEAAGDPREGRRPLSEFGPNRSTKDGLAYYCHKHAREMALETWERKHGRRKDQPAVAEPAPVPVAAVAEATPETVAASDSAVTPSLDGDGLFEMMAALERRMGDMETHLGHALMRLAALEETPPAPVPVAPPASVASPGTPHEQDLAVRLMEHMHDVCVLAENAARLHMLVTGGGVAAGGSGVAHAARG